MPSEGVANPPGQWWNPVPYLSKTADKESARLNFIWKQIIDPCDAPFTVWAWAFWPAAHHLVMAWFAIDNKQAVRTALRVPFAAESVRSRAHIGSREKKKRGKGMIRKNNPFAYDPTDWFGHEMSPWDEFPGFGPAPGELWFWSIVDVFERIAYYWMVFDLGTQFFYDWASGVAQTTYCHARDDAVLLATISGYPLLGIFGWDAMGYLDAVKQRKVRFFNGFGGSLEFGPGQVMVSARCEASGGDPAPWVEMRCRCLTGIRAGYTVTTRADIAPLGSVDMQVSAAINGDEVWIGEIRVNGGWYIHDPLLSMHAVYSEPPI